MNFITRFDQFILESVGHPDAINPYANLLLDTCMEKVEMYLNRKGKFHNWVNTIELDWNDIKEYVNKEQFLAFPVEHIILKFKIVLTSDVNVKKSTKSGWYENIGDESTIDSKSFVMVSNTGWIDESTFMRIGLSLVIPSTTKSYSLDTAEKDLESVIHHELTHAYDNYKTGDQPAFTPFYNAVQYVSEDLAKVKIHTNTGKVGRGYSIYPLVENLLETLYYYSPIETKANIGQAFAKGENSEYEINKLKDFSADKEYNDIIKSIDGGSDAFKETVMKYLNNIGSELVKYYLDGCEEADVDPIRGITKLKNKNYKQLLDYFEEKFHQRGEYMRRKIDKLRYTHKERETFVNSIKKMVNK